MPLSMVEVGKRVRLSDVQAGRALKARLASLGLIPGVEMEVVNNNMVGPFIVAVKGTRIVLGRSMALKIMVK